MSALPNPPNLPRYSPHLTRDAARCSVANDGVEVMPRVNEGLETDRLLGNRSQPAVAMKPITGAQPLLPPALHRPAAATQVGYFERSMPTLEALSLGTSTQDSAHWRNLVRQTYREVNDAYPDGIAQANGNCATVTGTLWSMGTSIYCFASSSFGVAATVIGGLGVGCVSVPLVAAAGTATTLLSRSIRRHATQKDAVLQQKLTVLAQLKTFLEAKDPRTTQEQVLLDELVLGHSTFKVRFSDHLKLSACTVAYAASTVCLLGVAALLAEEGSCARGPSNGPCCVPGPMCCDGPMNAAAGQGQNVKGAPRITAFLGEAEMNNPMRNGPIELGADAEAWSNVLRLKP